MGGLNSLDTGEEGFGVSAAFAKVGGNGVSSGVVVFVSGVNGAISGVGAVCVTVGGNGVTSLGGPLFMQRLEGIGDIAGGVLMVGDFGILPSAVSQISEVSQNDHLKIQLGKRKMK